MEWDKGEKTLYLEKESKKILKNLKTYFDRDEKKYSWISSLGNISQLEFIGNGRILKYTVSGWEFRSIGFYFVDEEKEVGGNGSLSLYGVTKNNKYLYICGERGMSGSPDFKIYDTITGELIKDLSKSYDDIILCNSYDRNNNILNFELDNGDSYKYNFDTESIKGLSK